MVRIREALVVASASLTIALLGATGGCGSSALKFGNGTNASTSDDASTDDGSTSTFAPTVDSGTSGGCVDGTLSCLVPANCSTTLSGTVYDPAGLNPLSNVVVYVPNDPAGTLPVITEGTDSCQTCDVSIGGYVSAVVTDAKGHFSLPAVPATTHVPFVVQIGKWRREVFLNEVTACTDNAVPAASSRLPRNQSEGSLPQIALLTGGADNLGCFLTGIGVDPKEYTAPHTGGRVDVYQGLPASIGILGGGAPGLSGGTAGDCTTSSCPLWNAKSSLEKYDIVLLSCEGDEYNDNGNLTRGESGNKTMAEKQGLHDWLDEGGKVFATHYHYTWFKNGPTADFQNIATWLGASSAGDSVGPNYDIDTSLSNGQLFEQWLANVNALTSTQQIALTDVAVSVSSVSTNAQRWIYDPSNNYTKYLSFLTPAGGAPAQADAAPETSGPQYCGKAVFTDLHAGGSPSGDVPAACATGPLSAQLKALEYLFFDLSACVSPDGSPQQMIPPPAR